MKVCTRCKLEKTESDFQVRAASKDGLTASCKKCLSDYDKSRANKPSRVKARIDYSKTEAGIAAANKARARWARDNKEKILETCSRYRKENKKKSTAHGIVGYAIKTGFLVSECCEVCGNPKTHAHHDDYNQPLSVRWLCSKHHIEWHKENGEGANG